MTGRTTLVFLCLAAFAGGAAVVWATADSGRSAVAAPHPAAEPDRLNSAITESASPLHVAASSAVQTAGLDVKPPTKPRDNAVQLATAAADDSPAPAAAFKIESITFPKSDVWESPKGSEVYHAFGTTTLAISLTDADPSATGIEVQVGDVIGAVLMPKVVDDKNPGAKPAAPADRKALTGTADATPPAGDPLPIKVRVVADSKSSGFVASAYKLVKDVPKIELVNRTEPKASDDSKVPRVVVPASQFNVQVGGVLDGDLATVTAKQDDTGDVKTFISPSPAAGGKPVDVPVVLAPGKYTLTARISRSTDKAVLESDVSTQGQR